MNQAVSLLLTFLLVTQGSAPLLAGAPAAAPGAEQNGVTLEQILEMTYLELFEGAHELNLAPNQAREFRSRIERERREEENHLKERRRAIDRAIDDSQSGLKDLNRRSEQTPEVERERHVLHCRIQELRKVKEEVELTLRKGLDIQFDNKLAKVQIVEEWPPRYAEISQIIEKGEAYDRKFSDFRDVGFRNGTFENQQQDVERGREIVEELKRRGLMPPEVEDPEVVRYINNLGARIARHSDLRVPLNISVLKSNEINAFALPGGFVYVNTGLILKAETESELAGVVAHEIAHAAARHSHRLMRRANIANIIFQAAQVAALIFTGGIGSIATYYALQTGFAGLGLVLDLSLLGVSRDFEVEADILGTQYLWHAGYDTRGFISFFGTMAQEAGYITGLSWFRTHPPFYERMEKSFKEILFLPRQEDPQVDSTEFQEVREKLRAVIEDMEKKDRDAPTLRVVYDCDDVLEEELGEVP